MQPQIYAGWRVLVRFNDAIVAAGSVVDYTIDTLAQDINTIDLVVPFEMAPQRVQVDLTLRVFRTPDNDPVSLGIAPQGNAGNLQDYFTRSKYITVEVRDKVTDRTVIQLPKAWVMRRSGGGEAESLFTETWSVRSIGYRGPAGQTSGLLNGSFF
jgi:hypothetical protein